MTMNRRETETPGRPTSPPPMVNGAVADMDGGTWQPANVALIATAGTVFILLVLRVWSALSAAPMPTEHVPTRDVVYRIDLNRASVDELAQLPGIGLITARRIVEDRTRHGPFRSVADLDRVRGIGTRTLERLRRWVFVAPRTDGEVPPSTNDRRIEPVSERKLDINRATAEELDRLPRIGPVLAERIIAARKEQPFVSVDDLQRVPGIGPKTINTLRPYISVGSHGSEVSNRK